MEKEAEWPRILVCPDLYSKIIDSAMAQRTLSHDGRYTYFDSLKFKYTMMVANPLINFSTKEDKISLTETLIKPYKSHIKLTTQEAALIYQHHKKQSLDDSYCPIKPHQYKKWLDFFNARIKWLIENDDDFSGRDELLLPDHFYEDTFNFPKRDNTEHFTVCLLPWIHIDKPYEVNGSRLLPFPDYEYDNDFKCAFKEILTSYKELNGENIQQCTIVAKKEGLPQWHLDKDSGDQIHAESNLELFFLAAFAQNNYFSQHSTYCNASAFQPIFQNFTIPPRGKAVQWRRRDGYGLDGGYQHGDLKYSRPLECKSLKPAIDEEFLKGLDSVSGSNSDLYRRILNSLSFIRLSNTDQTYMSAESETVLFAAAFEQLFDVQDKYCLTCEYKKCFDKFQTKTVNEVLAQRPDIYLNEGEHAGKDLQWQLGRKWIQELYDLRSAVVHGSDLTRRKWGWTSFEHLVIGAFVYPLTVKILISKKGHYVLTDRDKQLSMAIDQILSTNHWGDRVDENSNHTNWQEAIMEAGHKYRSIILAELLKDVDFEE